MTSHCARTRSLPHISTRPESKHQTYNARYSPLHLRCSFSLTRYFFRRKLLLRHYCQ